MSCKDHVSEENMQLSVEQLQQIEQNRRTALERLAIRNVPVPVGESWRREIGTEFTKPYFTKLMSFVTIERKCFTVYPSPEQVFMWTTLCAIEDVKVVILGQDPYHNLGQAHGLAFSVLKPKIPPPSLENIFMELTEDIVGFRRPGHGDLTEWAKQGVLLLNSVLTVRSHQPTSHEGQGWELFTDAVVQRLSSSLDSLVFLLWGSYAQRKGRVIDRKRHHILETSHPSPYSAHLGFFGCRHFSKTNMLLKKSGKTPVDWTAF
ncbi:uracil-DNA glycosylase isoform X1 [Triplophysa dalaica]|uniref:uracil-DNA glycosylase isoform X1 n=1 Tax=Triplophysa dalaica TaxID=1582913 RepID=UPI0024DF826D|nr:uracil-DNA glycosylase isoform X1 [Triplophysa dalaica]